MEVRVESLAEHILLIGCLCGEIDSSENESLFLEEKESYYKRVLGSLVSKHKLLYRANSRKGTGGNIIRLSSPNGEEAARRLSSEAYQHFEMLAGKKGNRYKGPKAHLKRVSDTATVIDKFFQMGYKIDFIWERRISNIERMTKSYLDESKESRVQSIFRKDGTLLSPEEMIRLIKPNDKCFFSSKALTKNRDEIVGTETEKVWKNGKYEEVKRLQLSRIYGVACENQNIIPIYYMASETYRWVTTGEELIKYFVERLKKEIESRSSISEAIIFTPNKEVLRALIDPKNRKGNNAKIKEVYDRAYFLPLKENYKDIKDYIFIENHRLKMASYLLGDKITPDETYDGLVDNREIYILLSNDLCRVIDIKKRIMLNLKDKVSMEIIIHPWQREIMEMLLGKENEYLSYNEVEEDDFKEVLLDLMSMAEG